MAETTEKTSEKKLSVATTKTLTLKGRGVERGWCARVSAMAAARRSLLRRSKAACPPEQGVRPRPRLRRRPNALLPPSRPSRSRRPPRRPLRHRRLPSRLAWSCAPYRGGAHGAGSRPGRCPAAGSGGAQDCGRRGDPPESRESTERVERDAAGARKAEEEKRRKHELETKLKAEQEAKKRFGEDAAGRPVLDDPHWSRTRKRRLAPGAAPGRTACARARSPRAAAFRRTAAD